MSNGKGSRPRPMAISREEYARRYDEAFGNKEPQKVCLCDRQGYQEVKEERDENTDK